MISNCCNAKLVLETDLCGKCFEHCEPVLDADYMQEVLDISNRRIYLNGKEVK